MAYKYRVSIVRADGAVQKVIHEGSNLENAVQIQNTVAAEHAKALGRNDWHLELHKFTRPKMNTFTSPGLPIYTDGTKTPERQIW